MKTNLEYIIDGVKAAMNHQNIAPLAIERVINEIKADLEGILPPCFAKADHNEPVFVLRAQDESAPKVVRYWVTSNQHITSAKQRAAMQVVDEMMAWPDKKKAD